MTVKQFLEVTPATQKVHILNAHGCTFNLDRHDPLTLAAFADFAIHSVEASDTDTIEISLKLAPIREC